MKQNPDIYLNMDTFEIFIQGTPVKAETYEEARFVFDALNQLRAERQALEIWVHRAREYVERFPLGPTTGSGT